MLRCARRAAWQPATRATLLEPLHSFLSGINADLSASDSHVPQHCRAEASLMEGLKEKGRPLVTRQAHILGERTKLKSNIEFSHSISTGPRFGATSYQKYIQR